MRIGIDMRPMQGETRFRGIGKTQEFFMQALASVLEKTDHSLVFYIDADLPQPPAIQLFPAAQIEVVKSPKLGRRRYFRSFLSAFATANPKPKDVDAFLQFDVSLGVPRKVPVVAIFYDLIPLLFREQEKQLPSSLPLRRRLKDRLAGAMYWQKYLRFLAQFQRPSHLLAISESSRNDLIAHQPSLKHKISLVPLGVDSAFFHAGKASARMQKLARQPFLLYVGGIDTRKNIVELLRTFYALKPDYPQLRLVVAGKEFTFTDQLGDRGWFDELRKNPSYAKDVIATGFVTQEELLFLYAHAECFVFPSLYEGFGLPILEAMAAGCPVVAYNTSSIPEVAGDACILKDPEESLAGAVRTMLSTPKIREDYRKAGRTRAAQFTWDNTAKAILAKLESYE